MFHMLSCFNLKSEISIDEFNRCLEAFADHMKEQELIESVGPMGLRDSDTPMDTDDQRDHQYFFMTNFIDKAQCDRSYGYILGHTEPGSSFHDNVYTKVENPVFICFADMPGSIVS